MKKEREECFFFFSISSSYKVLMPQFLRYIKILCNLYPYYCQASQAYHSVSPVSQSTSRVRRTDSFGDSSRPRRSATLSFFTNWSSSGHRRANSHGSPLDLTELKLERENMISESLPSLQFPSDPMDHLETVWSSLRSWFDLLQMEILKLPEIIETDVDVQEVKEVFISDTIDSGVDSMSPQLAAAIILSAPPKRRQVYLMQSNSINSDDVSSFVANNAALKRRSWHVDRVAHAMVSLEGASSLPSFQRSVSSDPSSCSTGIGMRP